MSSRLELVTKAAREREQTQQSVISFAEELLAEAKAGNVGAIVLATKDTKGEWRHRLTHNLNLREEIGGLFCLLVGRSEQVLGEFEDE